MRRRADADGSGKRERQRLVREIVAEGAVTSQQALVDQLAIRGIRVTQATVSRDIGEIGLVKVSTGGRHVYTSPDGLSQAPADSDDERLRHVLAEYPVRVGRSGLTLLLLSEAGTAGAIAQAIDDSTLHEQEGTLAGDDTVLVLFADEPRLRAWLTRFEALRQAVTRMESTR
jgi:transcriptional regulator of arginine metabolism